MNDADFPDPPVDPEEAEALVSLLEPLQQATGVGNSIGGALNNTPYPPVRLLGNLMQLSAQGTQTTVTAAETVPSALSVYVEAQEEGARALAPPPPDEVLDDLRGNLEALRALREQIDRDQG